MRSDQIFVLLLVISLPISGCLESDPAADNGSYSFQSSDGVDDGAIMIEMLEGEDISYSIITIYVESNEFSECSQGEEVNCWARSDSTDDVWSVGESIDIYTGNEGTYSATIDIVKHGEDGGTLNIGHVKYSNEPEPE
jgi:hypothetical protein